MHSQVQRGISLIILPLPSERAGERLLFPIPSSQTHRGISLIVLPLPSERAGERLLFPHFVLSNTTGYLAYYSLSLRRGLGRGCFFLTPSSLNTLGNLANCSPSPFGEGWGEAVSGMFQAASSLDNQGRKHAYRTTFSAHKRKRRPRIAARPPSKSSI